MSENNGNGVKVAEARRETVCPVSPTLLPEQCSAINTTLEGIRRTLEEQTRTIRNQGETILSQGKALSAHSATLRSMVREQAATRTFVERVGKTLKKLEEAHGMKGR